MRRAEEGIKLAQQMGPNYGGHLIFRSSGFPYRMGARVALLCKEDLRKMNLALVDRGGKSKKPQAMCMSLPRALGAGVSRKKRIVGNAEKIKT